MEDPLWPSDDQKKMFKESLKTSMSSRLMGSMFSSNKKNKSSDNTGAGAGGSKKLIVKRKRKFIKKK